MGPPDTGITHTLIVYRRRVEVREAICRPLAVLASALLRAGLGMPVLE